MSDPLALSRREMILAAAGSLLTVAACKPARGNGQSPDSGSSARATLSAGPVHFERVEVAGADALTEWERLRGQDHGWPVVVGNDDNLAQVTEHLETDPIWSPQATLKRAERMNYAASLRQLRSRNELSKPTVGQWPTAFAPTPMLSVARDVLTRKPFERVHILLVPTRRSYEVPAYLNWGGWNACPSPEFHVAALRQWQRGYGAELIGLSGEVMDLRVRSRPTSRREALALARDQYDYCSDIVDQGLDDISTLAATLMASDWWYFWWD